MRHPRHLMIHRIALAAVILAGTAAGVSAADSPWYVQARFGQSSVDDARLSASNFNWRVDGEQDSGAVEVGYAFNRFLAVEAGYHDLGTYSGSNLCDSNVCTTQNLVVIPVEADVSAFSLAAVPTWHATERVSVRGKLGIIGWQSDLTAGASAGRDGTASGEDLLAGIGVGYEFPRGLGLLLEYEQFDFDVASTSVGVSWRF